MGENWAAFSPSCKGKMPPNLQEKNGQHFVLLLYKILPPKNYSSLSLNYGNLLASHSAVPRPFRQLSFAVLLAPPSDPFGIYDVWGSTFPFCPSPGSLRDQQGMGRLEVEEISTLDLSSRDVRFAQRKSKTEFLGPTQNNVALA